MRKLVSAAAALALGASLLTGGAALAKENITSGGSSFAGTIMTTCAAAYTKHSVTYTPSSSGTGRANFTAGSINFAGSDATYSATDAKPSKFTYVPVVGGPVTVVYNVAGLATLNLTPTVLGQIFQGKITTWDHPSIKKHNPKADLPDEKINVVYRSSKSGTTENLANYMVQNKVTGWVKDGNWNTATSQSTPAGIGAATSSDLVTKIKQTTYSIGYVDLSDSNKKHLPYAAIKNPSGQFVKPTVAATAAFLAAQKVNKDGSVTINYLSKVKNAYNLAAITYAIAPTADGTAKGDAVRDFLGYVVNSCAQSKAASLGYVALTGGIKTTAQALVKKVN